MSWIYRSIPNFFTSLNLLCGSIAILAALEGELVHSSYLVFLGVIFDYLDGFSARYLKKYSEFGKQLDSLADMVTFVVVPGLIMLQLLRNYNADFIHQIGYLQYLPLLIIIFSALRLAKFMIDTRQKINFIGLPTPANALYICSLPLILLYDRWQITNLITHPMVLLITTVILSYLLICELPLFSLKFSSFRWADNKLRFSFLIISLLLLLVLFYTAIPIIIILYILISAIAGRREILQQRNQQV